MFTGKGQADPENRRSDKWIQLYLKTGHDMQISLPFQLILA